MPCPVDGVGRGSTSVGGLVRGDARGVEGARREREAGAEARTGVYR